MSSCTFRRFSRMVSGAFKKVRPCSSTSLRGRKASRQRTYRFCKQIRLTSKSPERTVPGFSVSSLPGGDCAAKSFLPRPRFATLDYGVQFRPNPSRQAARLPAPRDPVQLHLRRRPPGGFVPARTRSRSHPRRAAQRSRYRPLGAHPHAPVRRGADSSPQSLPLSGAGGLGSAPQALL